MTSPDFGDEMARAVELLNESMFMASTTYQSTLSEFALSDDQTTLAQHLPTFDPVGA